VKNTHKDSRFNDWSKTTVKLKKRPKSERDAAQWTKYGKARKA